MGSKFFFIFIFFYFFCTHCKISHKTRMHALIKLKLHTHKGLINANLSTNFGWNLMKIYWVMINFLLKIRRKVSHTYVRPQEWVETWHVDITTIIAVHFCDVKAIKIRTIEIRMTLPNSTSTKITWSSFIVKNWLVFITTVPDKLLEKWTENQFCSCNNHHQVRAVVEKNLSISHNDIWCRIPAECNLNSPL